MVKASGIKVQKPEKSMFRTNAICRYTDVFQAMDNDAINKYDEHLNSM